MLVVIGTAVALFQTGRLPPDGWRAGRWHGRPERCGLYGMPLTGEWKLLHIDLYLYEHSEYEHDSQRCARIRRWMSITLKRHCPHAVFCPLLGQAETPIPVRARAPTMHKQTLHSDSVTRRNVTHSVPADSRGRRHRMYSSGGFLHVP